MPPDPQPAAAMRCRLSKNGRGGALWVMLSISEMFVNTFRRLWGVKKEKQRGHIIRTWI
jgi:hypothetical protein